MSDYFYDEEGNIIGDSIAYGEERYKQGFEAGLKASRKLLNKLARSKGQVDLFIKVSDVEKIMGLL